MISYAVVIERASDGGYGAWCPDLPGCVALADTEEAVLAEMRQAIELHPARLRQDGKPLHSALNRGSNRYHSRCSLTPLAAVLRSLRFFLLGDHLGTTRHTYARTNRRWLPVVHGQLDASELRRRLLPRSGGQGVAGS